MTTKAYIISAAAIEPALTRAVFYLNGKQTMIGTLDHKRNGDATFEDLSEGVTMGAATDPVCGWVGDIAEELVYDRQLSTAEIKQITAYLSTKYTIHDTATPAQAGD